jgi:hypothetical protein
MFTANSNFDYRKRQFESLPAGFRATNRDVQAVTGKLDIPALDLSTATGGTGVIRCGLMLMRGGKVGDINLYKLPDNTATNFNIEGVLFYDETNYRFKHIQPQFSHNNGDLVSVVREGDMRVIKIGAIPNNARVYCINAVDATNFPNETPGMVKATAGANAILLNNCRWGEVTTDAGIAAITLEMTGGTFV